ncbi:PLP-dependent aminotransferase family protein [Metapseudomonas furukawaii]|uniref:aminotransferase-like domain-containing protein n=1 Tax=Metapseudomonas furukawaii TaxID=1149133 RepID=UPI00227B8DE1|nr:PLP-dependent aminotransferase family protein [Pseudomonas furukawaii]WAG77349.1 PLP-dependent aminotransferase family protein [Pseudomonas furukawaii]
MTVNMINDTVPFLREALDSGPGTKYRRLADAMERQIRSGSLEPGSKLPPHRILADRLGITAGTVSRAYAELEYLGLVVARVGDGTFVCHREIDRKRDAGFRNATEGVAEHFDMSRNMHIPGQETTFLAKSLVGLAGDPRRLHELMSYSPERGLLRHRQAGARWLALDEFRPQAEQVLCTNGGQHGLLCTLMALLRPGDTVVTEQLTYPGLISAARMLGIRLMGVMMDEEGVIPASLDEICRQNRVSALYCTPTLQNPTTAVMSPSRRQEIASLCRAHNLLIVEDKAHAVLVKDRPLPLSHYAPERSILIGSLSKAVAAGLRVGYLHAPTALLGRLALALRGSCWMATPLAMELASEWIESGIAEQLLRQQISELERRKALVEGLLEGLSFRTHPQSPHYWVEVPEPWRASDVEADLKLKNFLISTAEAFAVGRAAVPQFVRVSVSNSTHDDGMLAEGFRLLVGALRPDAGRVDT